MASVPKMTLYQSPKARSLKCLWLIYELGIQDSIELKTVRPLEKDTEVYREYQRTVHPHGTIPALVVEGEGVILESTAICLYLADLYGKLAPPLDKRREFYDWAMYSSITIEAILQFLFWQWMTGKPDPEGIKKQEEKWDICMKRLTDTLAGRKFLLGDQFTVADILVGYCVHGAGQDIFNNGSLIKKHPAIQAYVKRLTERPAFQAAEKAQGEFRPPPK